MRSASQTPDGVDRSNEPKPVATTDSLLGPPKVLTIANVSFAYGRTPVLHSVDLELRAGEIFALVGPSGCGKSTLLRCIAGLDEPSSGSISLANPSVNRRRSRSRSRPGVGLVFQQFNLFPHRSVLDNLTMPLRVTSRLDRATARERALRELRRVGLVDFADRYPLTMSGGQQQRIAIARMLVMRPQVMLLDEITSSLDPTLSADVLDLVRTLADDGLPMLMVTHELEFVARYSNRTAVMYDGRIIEQGPTQRMFDSAVEPRAQTFLRPRNRTSASTQLTEERPR